MEPVYMYKVASMKTLSNTLLNILFQGEVCSNGTRVFIQSGIYEDFVKYFVKYFRVRCVPMEPVYLYKVASMKTLSNALWTRLELFFMQKLRTK